MKKANLIYAAVCIILSVYVIVTAKGYPTGSGGDTGPGTFPILVSILLLGSAIALVFTSLKMEDVPIDWINPNTKPVYISMAALVAYTVIMAQVGFVVTSFVFVACMIQWFKKGKPVVNVLISAVFVGIVYGVFSGLLNVPMNFGILI